MWSDREEKGIALFKKKKFKEAIASLSGEKRSKVNVKEDEFEEIIKQALRDILLAYGYQQAGERAIADKHFAAYTRLLIDYFNYKSGIDSFTLDTGDLYDTSFYEELYHTGQEQAIIAAWLQYLHTTGAGVLAKRKGKQAVAEELAQWGSFYGILYKNHPFEPLNNAIELSAAKQKQAWKLAMDAFDKALAYHQNNGEIYYLKAKQLAKKNVLQACQHYEQALEINPNHAGALLELQKIYLNSADYDLVIRYGRHYLAVSKKCDDYFNNQPDYMNFYRCSGYDEQYTAERVAGAYFEKGNQLLYGKHKYDEAEACFKACIDLYPKLGAQHQEFEMPWVALADSYLFKGDYKRALKQAEKALQVNHVSVKAWSVKGNSLSLLKRYKEALQCYEEALGRDEEYFYPYFGKACILALTNGDKKEIYQLVKKALALDPDQKTMMANEPDFAGLRDDPKFQKLFK